MKTITRYINDVKPFTIVVRDKVSRKPVDITGCVIKLSVKASASDLDANAKYFNANVPHIIETSGLARTPAVTFNWPEAQYLLQTKIIDAAGHELASEMAAIDLKQSLFKPA